MPKKKLVEGALDVVRKLNPLGFYSKAAEEAAKLPQAKGTGEQMRSMLLKQGAKPEELKWTGFDDWVKGKKSVTRDEITDYLNKNQLKLEEKVLGPGMPTSEQLRIYYDMSPEVWDNLPARDYLSLRNEYLRNENLAGPTKFDEYTFPGGQNYRETLLTAPGFREPLVRNQYADRMAELEAQIAKNQAEILDLYKSGADDNRFAALKDETRDLARELGGLQGRMSVELKDAPKFQSSHWDDPNIFAHLRTKEREAPTQGFVVRNNLSGNKSETFGTQEEAAAYLARMPEGMQKNLSIVEAAGKPRRVLHLEELQSDWAQAGRKSGFGGMGSPEYQALQAEAESLRRLPLGQQLEGGKDVQQRLDEIYAQQERMKVGPPTGPFVESTPGWTNLALKKAMIEAARGNYDAIAWTPGAEQAKRFDLSRQLSGVEYHEPSGTFSAFDPSGRKVISQTYKPEELPGVVGKEVAERLLSAQPGDMGVRSLQGLDLAVGGEGMKGYYDKILPTQISKVLKDIGETPQFGNVSFARGNVGASGDDIMNALPETRAMDEAQRSEWWRSLDPQRREQLFEEYRTRPEEFPSFNITPEMREKINQGLPLFTMMPAAVGLGATASQMQDGQNPAEQPEGFNKGGIVRKALEAIRGLPPAENSRLTQIATTGPSYEKALRHLERAGIEGRAIDYGAGRGHGLRAIGADTFEPYPQGWTPTFTKPEDIPDEAYRRLVNLNVLNVLDPEAREAALLNMGRVVEPGGGGVISTRGRDVMSARGEPGPEPMSLIIGEGDSARYQKGFTPRELREYVGDTLGPRFDIEPSDVGAASIMFRRNREDGGRTVDDALRLIQDRYPTQYLPNVGRQVMADGGFPISEGEQNAQLNDAIAYADRLDRAARIRDVGQALGKIWPVQVAKSVVGGMALPRDVYAGEVDPTSEIGIQRAMDLAGSVMGGGMTVGSAPRGSIGMFLGPSAKTADLQALEVARDMAKQGATRDEIYDATKWFQGADKQWRFEVPDTAASMRPGYIEKSTVGEAIDHPELFKAYPQLSDVEFYASPLKRTKVQGGWSGNPNVKDTFPTLEIGQYAKDPRSTALHELQHAVQTMENFAPGGNTFVLKPGTPAWDIYQERLAAMRTPVPLETYAAVAGFGDDLEAARKSYPSYLKAVKKPSAIANKSAQEYAVESAYKRSAGEVEARNVQTRDKSGYDKKPWETQDVSDEMQIVRERSKEKDGGAVEDALHVVRGMYADGGEPEEYVSPQARRRETIASIQPDAPEFTPEERGRMFRQAVENYQRFPARAGEAELRAYEMTPREQIGRAIAGEGGERAPGGQFRANVARALVGNTGLEGSGMGFGAADLPMVTGIPLMLSDIAGSIGKGNYGQAALEAALPAAFYARKPLMAAGRAAYDAGRRAVDVAGDVLGRVPAPVAAGAAGAAAMTPEEAEAGKAKMVQQVLQLVRTAERPPNSRFVSQAGEHGYFVPQRAKERDPRRWHPLSTTVLSRPLGEMHAERAMSGDVMPRQYIRPEDLEGGSLVAGLGDRTAGGSRLLGVNEMRLRNPVEMQAGHSFMYGSAASGPDRAIWASDPGVITILANKAKAEAEAGYQPYLSYVAMGSRSGDYSHHMADTLREMLRNSKVSRDTIAEFDRQMRENTANKWAPYADWPGLKSKNLEAYLYGGGPRKSRTKMAELMGQGQFQKLGMPDVGAARFAITDPALLHAQDYSAGHSIAKIDPLGRIIKDPVVPHKTYRSQLGAAPDKGYVGGFEYDIPFEVMNKEYIDELMARDAEKYSNPSQLAYTYRMDQPVVRMTPEVVDRLSTFIEMKRRGLVP